MNKYIIIVLTVLLFPREVLSQNESAVPLVSKKTMRKARPTYIGISPGISISTLRDFATSPLIYKGVPAYILLSRVRLDFKRESQVGLSYSSGRYRNSFNDNAAVSKVKVISVFYSQLYQLNKWSTEKRNVKIGGLFNTTLNNRINPTLLNNQVGAELIPTLFASIKVSQNVSRNRDKDKKFLFINYKLKQRSRSLAFRLNLGLLNNSYRNGYTYNGQAQIVNNENLGGYQFNALSGFRTGSTLDYSISLKNKNNIKLSYLWDAYKTGGDFKTFEIASHSLSLTLLFNTNNK